MQMAHGDRRGWKNKIMREDERTRLWIASEILLSTGRSHSYSFSFLPLSIYVFPSFCLSPLPQKMLQWEKKKAPVPISQANLLALYTSFGPDHTAHQQTLSFLWPTLWSSGPTLFDQICQQNKHMWTSPMFDMILSTGQKSHQDARTLSNSHICSHQCIKKNVPTGLPGYPGLSCHASGYFVENKWRTAQPNVIKPNLSPTLSFSVHLSLLFSLSISCCSVSEPETRILLHVFCLSSATQHMPSSLFCTS